MCHFVAINPKPQNPKPQNPKPQNPNPQTPKPLSPKPHFVAMRYDTRSSCRLGARWYNSNPGGPRPCGGRHGLDAQFRRSFGFRVLGFGVQGLGFRVLGFRV